MDVVLGPETRQNGIDGRGAHVNAGRVFGMRLRPYVVQNGIEPGPDRLEIEARQVLVVEDAAVLTRFAVNRVDGRARVEPAQIGFDAGGRIQRGLTVPLAAVR